MGLSSSVLLQQLWWFMCGCKVYLRLSYPYHKPKPLPKSNLNPKTRSWPLNTLKMWGPANVLTLLVECVFWYYIQKHTQAHLHSLLSWLIWSVTKLCSRKETSAELTAARLVSLEEANSMTQWAKAKVKCRSVRVSVWGCCEKTPGNSTD